MSQQFVTQHEFRSAVARIKVLENDAEELRLDVLVKLARIETILKLGFALLGVVGSIAAIVFTWWLSR